MRSNDDLNWLDGSRDRKETADMKNIAKSNENNLSTDWMLDGEEEEGFKDESEIPFLGAWINVGVGRWGFCAGKEKFPVGCAEYKVLVRCPMAKSKM